MFNAVIRKLELFARLSAEERSALTCLLDENVQRIPARHDIIREGEKNSQVVFVLDGWGARYKELQDGRRQIVSLFLPGDVCEPHAFLLREMDHSVCALTRVRIASVPHERYEALIDRYDRIGQAMRWQELVSTGVQLEWALNLGQRTALERIGHLLCETFVRFQSMGMIQGDSCDFPIVQNDLADMTGLTPVHVNRTLQELRREGLIVLENRRLAIPDLERLKQVTFFNPNYLHLQREGAHLDANERAAIG